MKISKAFTLAEVLITLGIIGVVAAMTLPSVIYKIRETIIVHKVIVSYSILSEAYKRAIIEYGDPVNWNLVAIDSDKGGENIYNNITPFLKSVKSCKITKTCFYNGKYKALDGKTNGNFISPGEWGTAKSQGQLANGVSFCFWSAGLPLNNGSIGSIMIDINGPKPPNQAGVDYFSFYLMKNDLFPSSPATTLSQTCIYNNKSASNGMACTGWVIRKKNMDYLRRDISSEYNF